MQKNKVFFRPMKKQSSVKNFTNTFLPLGTLLLAGQLWPQILNFFNDHLVGAWRKLFKKCLMFRFALW